MSYNGKDYDYVFDVDIDDGKPPLKLPFNVTENPYTVAQKFVDDNGLTQSHVDDVARFIIKNTEGLDISTSAAQSEYGSRYLPGGSSAPAAPAGTNTSSSLLPHNDYVRLVSFEPLPILNALKRSNTTNPVLSDSDLDQIQCDLTSLTPHSADSLLQVVTKLTNSWPIDNLLPVFDILRIIVPSLSNPGSVAVVQLIFSGLDPSLPKHTLLATRALVNLISVEKGRKLVSQPQVASQAFEVLGSVVCAQPTPEKARDLAIASLLLNYAVANSLPVAEVAAIDALVMHMGTSEAVYRALLALGTFASHGKRPNHSTVAKLKAVAAAFNEPRFNDLFEGLKTLGI
jgi:phospholipase A-2-activating protein